VQRKNLKESIVFQSFCEGCRAEGPCFVVTQNTATLFIYFNTNYFTVINRKYTRVLYMYAVPTVPTVPTYKYK